MIKAFDTTFFIGLFFVAASIAVAAYAVSGRTLPLFGGGRGPLVAVAIIGMTGCAIAGISHAMSLGWTDPLIVFGSVVGVMALAVIAAGLFGWDGIVRPVAALVPGGSLGAASTEDLALVAITGIIALKFVVNLAFAVARSAS